MEAAQRSLWDEQNGNKKPIMFSSLFYESDDKKSSNSDKIRSIQDLISDFNPNHVSAFQPPIKQVEKGDKKDENLMCNENLLCNEELQMDRSQPFSFNMINMLDSHQFFNHDLMYRSADLKRKGDRIWNNPQMNQSSSFQQSQQDMKGNIEF